MVVTNANKAHVPVYKWKNIIDTYFKFVNNKHIIETKLIWFYG
jgi:hypothetical protein